jgi:hypothetical protein
MSIVRGQMIWSAIAVLDSSQDQGSQTFLRAQMNDMELIINVASATSSRAEKIPSGFLLVQAQG